LHVDLNIEIVSKTCKTVFVGDLIKNEHCVSRKQQAGYCPNDWQPHVKQGKRMQTSLKSRSYESHIPKPQIMKLKLSPFTKLRKHKNLGIGFVSYKTLTA